MTPSKRLASALAALVLAGSAAAADLGQVYRLAAQNDPVLREAEANYFAARETKPQAWALYLPQLNGYADAVNSDSDATTPFFDVNTSQFVTRPVTTNSTSHTQSLELRQTVFNWSEIKGIQAAGAAVAQAEAEYDAALQEFIVRTADRYFGQLSTADQLEAQRLNREALGNQLEQSKKRFEVGLIAVTDVQESQAAYDQAIADEIAAERAFQSSREQLRVSTGDYVDDLTRPGEDMPLKDPQPASPDAWVKLALEQNLSLVASRFAAEAAAHSLGAAWGSHFPTVDLVASKSHFTRDTDQTLDTGSGLVSSHSGADQDGNTYSLQLAVPLFAGGATQSKVRQAKYRSRAADDRLERVTRETQRQARDALLGVTTEISRTKALRQAAESSATALRATEAGFEVGTRTSVDVIDSRRNLLRAQVTYRRAKYDYLLNTLRLKQAAGMLVEADVTQVNTWLTNTAAPTPMGEPTK